MNAGSPAPISVGNNSIENTLEKPGPKGLEKNTHINRSTPGKNTKNISVLISLLLFFFSWGNVLAGNNELVTLQDYTRHSMDLWRVPGLAMAAVQDGRVIFQKGFGLRDINKENAVTPGTMLAIGSSSKAFTAIVP